MELPSAPSPQFVISADGLKIATYEWGDETAQTVLLVHGFASSALANFVHTGWTRDLVRAGFHVLAIDQRGHGASEKPHDSDAYRLNLLVSDILTVLDTFMIAEADYVGYSLGARVGWRSASAMPNRISRAVLGGIPDGIPLTRFHVGEALAWIDQGVPITDTITNAYLTMAGAVGGNDLKALIALVVGLRTSPDAMKSSSPIQPILFATGANDAIIDRSRQLSNSAPNGRFFEIPSRNHFNAPTSRSFRDAAIDFLTDPNRT
jgi:pimeloyl-ACP methyl ester carboxylesterase